MNGTLYRIYKAGSRNPTAIVMCPGAFAGAAYCIDLAMRACAAIHGLPLPVA